MAAQVLARSDAARGRPQSCAVSGSSLDWKRRVEALSRKGVTEADVRHWSWVLSPVSCDKMSSRLVADANRFKPLFMVLLSVARNKTFRQGRHFAELLDYIDRTHVRNPALARDTKKARKALHGSMAEKLIIRPSLFTVLIERLVQHCMRIWPAAIVKIAHLVLSYLKTIPLDSQRAGGHAHRNHVFNHALQSFRRLALINPLAHASYNWQAQRLLLQLSTDMKPALFITRDSYRAIRDVMVSLKKTNVERKAATRSARTWPPYRKVWDGLDERRDPADDVSRCVKAGILMREAGYDFDIKDKTVDVLGGSSVVGTPTVLTRSMRPFVWKAGNASLNVFSMWAAQVKATRNATEAWLQFNTPPGAGLVPNFQVFGEMFQKLTAKEVPESSTAVPGDVKEVFPVWDASLSAFEIARRTPPTVDELYEQMLRSGNRPTRDCLAHLLAHAGSLEKGVRYMRDSPYRDTVGALMSPSFTFQDRRKLGQLPRSAFNAWIELLCQTHVNERKAMRDGSEQEESNLSRAIKLIYIYHSENHWLARVDKLPWYRILDSFMAGKRLPHPRVGWKDAIETLSVSLKIYDVVQSRAGLDPRMFDSLCDILRRSMSNKWFLSRKPNGTQTYSELVDGETERVLCEGRSRLLASFECLTRPVRPRRGEAAEAGEVAEAAEAVKAADGQKLSWLQPNKLSARTLHRYMRAMAVLGDVDEMIRIMDWVLAAWDTDGVLDEAKKHGEMPHIHVGRMFCYFADMAGSVVPADVVKDYGQRLALMSVEKACTWFWPSERHDDFILRADRELAIFWRPLSMTTKWRERRETGGRDAGSRPWKQEVYRSL